MTTKSRPSAKKCFFGITSAGAAAHLFTLSNSADAAVEITDYGGRIVSLKMPDRNGKFADIVLGYDALDDYLNDAFFFGGIIGRYANRIARGRFSLDGKDYQLATNDGANHLQGGRGGFDARLWRAETSVITDGAALKLSYLSADGEENYPGNLAVEVVYTLTGDNELQIEYAARTDEDTPLNLTNHAYFNLAGAGTILDHEVSIDAAKFTPTAADLIPTGERREVENTPFDFRRRTKIGTRIEQPDEKLRFGGGYDHNWILNNKNGALASAAKVFEPSSGRVLEVLTTEPGLHFYSGNFLADVKGKQGKIYRKREGFCLEAQHFPDSPNRADFPPTILRKGQIYSQTTVYKFSVEAK